ncbi:MAG: outer membrane beta-barrel protein [Bacteroidota bacterium]
MKSKLLAIFLCIAMSPAFSQIRRTQWIVGGGLNYSSRTEEVFGVATIDEKQFSIPVSAGYFVANNIALGLRLAYGYIKESISYTSFYFRDYSYSGSSIAGGPFLRGYLLSNTSPVNFVVETGYQYGHMESMYQRTGLKATSQTRKLSVIAIEAGPVFFLNPNIALECLLGYRNETIIGSKNNANAFYIGAGFQVHLGKGKIAEPKFKK